MGRIATFSGQKWVRTLSPGNSARSAPTISQHIVKLGERFGGIRQRLREDGFQSHFVVDDFACALAVTHGSRDDVYDRGLELNAALYDSGWNRYEERLPVAGLLTGMEGTVRDLCTARQAAFTYLLDNKLMERNAFALHVSALLSEVPGETPPEKWGRAGSILREVKERASGHQLDILCKLAAINASPEVVARRFLDLTGAVSIAFPADDAMHIAAAAMILMDADGTAESVVSRLAEACGLLKNAFGNYGINLPLASYLARAPGTLAENVVHVKQVERMCSEQISSRKNLSYALLLLVGAYEALYDPITFLWRAGRQFRVKSSGGWGTAILGGLIFGPVGALGGFMVGRDTRVVEQQAVEFRDYTWAEGDFAPLIRE